MDPSPAHELVPPAPDDAWGRFYGWIDGGRDVWVRPGHLVERHASIELLHPADAIFTLGHWERDAFEVLESIHHRAFGRAEERDPLERRRAILARIEEAVESGHLVLHASRREPAGHRPTPPARPSPERPRIPEPKREPTWIEISLVDERPSPVADEVVLIVDPGGVQHHVTTDEHGLARLGGIDPGVCDISFPRIDGREWTTRGGTFPRGSDGVAYVHTVQPRECIARIAHRYAFRCGTTLWDHACNAALRRAGRKPDVLWPGDRVQVLERDARIEEGGSGRRHHFVVKTAVRWLRLVLHDVFRQPLRETAYVMSLPGRPAISGSTDGTGLLEEIIPPAATEATISAGDYLWRVAIADLRPVEAAPDDGREGVLRRLRNLGCPARREPAPGAATEGSTHESEAAGACDADVLLHQLRVGWSASGELDDATQRAVVAEYGA